MKAPGGRPRWLPISLTMFSAVVWGVSLVWSVAQHPLWEDEAYNLTVVRNLVNGLGYSSDGILRFGTVTPFDPAISTGPVVLLPAAGLHAFGIPLVLSGRLVTAAFAVLLAVAAYTLGARCERLALGSVRAPRPSIAGALASMLPLTFDTWLTISPIQGPADVLGEFAAAALLLWAVCALPRRPWLAGLLVGLAIQTKLIALLAIPAFVVALLWTVPGWRRRVREVLVAGTGVMLPTVLYEAWILIALGPSGFHSNLRDQYWFLRSHTADYSQPNTPGQKLELFSRAWMLPPAAAVAVGLCLLGLLVLLLVSVDRQTAVTSRRSLNAVVVCGLIGAGTFVLWWVFSSRTPLWVRHPAIGMLAFVPAIGAGTFGLLAAGGWRRAAPVRWLVGGLGAIVVVAVLCQTGAYGWAQISGTSQTSATSLSRQRADAAELRRGLQTLPSAREWVAVPWGGAVSMAVLADRHVRLVTQGSAARTPRLMPAGGCSPAVASAGEYVVCSASR